MSYFGTRGLGETFAEAVKRSGVATVDFSSFYKPTVDEPSAGKPSGKPANGAAPPGTEPPVAPPQIPAPVFVVGGIVLAYLLFGRRR